MNVIVTYDISRNRTRSKMHKFLRELGIRTQKSVFECNIDSEELQTIRRFARNVLDLKKDSLCVYHVCKNCYAGAEVQGKGIQVTQLEYQLF